MLNRRTLLGAGTAASATLAVTAAVATPVRARAAVPWHRLRAHLRGDLVLPSEAGYEIAKQLDLAQFDTTNPKAVAYCETARDVALCLRFAQDHAVRVAPRSGGHSLGGYSTTTGLVIDVSRLNAVSVRPRAVTFGPGAQNVDVLNAMAPDGLAVTGGAHATVAAGGFVMGGGLGFLTPSLGMACDQLTRAEVVLADGRVVTACEREHPDLYWALRGGGGGNFGVVTSYTLTPSAVTTAHTANLAFSYDRALEMVDGFARWLADAPRTIGGACVIVLPDAAPGATPMPVIRVVATGTSEEFDAEVARLTSLTGPPASRTSDALPYRDLMMNVYGCASLSVPQCHRE
jgi:FAD/FMN-containing dehydrogenase